MTSNFPDREPEHGTDAEIEAAIRSMSDVDRHRLEKIAIFRARGLRGLGLGIDANDLLQDAIMRTFAGVRRWKKEVAFVKHLIETMRSIANHARDELKGLVAASDSTEMAEDKGDALGGALMSRFPDSEVIVEARNELARISKHFAGDDSVGLLIEGLSTGMSGPEIQRDLGLSLREYETVMTRLRRGARQDK